jgi:Tol biopolymer transport system component
MAGRADPLLAVVLAGRASRGPKRGLIGFDWVYTSSMKHSFLEVSLAVSACAVLAAAEPVRSEPTTPAVVFERGGDLYAVSIDGSRTVRLTTTRVEEREPAVSPDGSTIAFARGFGGGISTINVDGSGRRIVTRAGDDPAWAPDGRTIYFVRYRSAFAGESCGSIVRVAASGRPIRRVTRSTGVHSHLAPAVSPDGQRIAFSDWKGCAGGTSSPRLRVVDRSGRPTQELAKLRRNGYWPDPEHTNPAWSPDGEWLAFLRNGDLTIARRDGSAEHRVARGGGYALYASPSWSPDGSWIAFSTAASVRLVHPDGAGLRRLARNTRSIDYSVGGWLPRLPS